MAKDDDFGRLVWWRPISFHDEIVRRHYWTMGHAPSEAPSPPTSDDEFAEWVEHGRFKGVMERDYTLTRADGPGPHAPLVTGLFACAPYWVTLRLAMGDGGALELGSVEIQSQADEAGHRAPILKTDILRSIPLPRMVAGLKEMYIRHLRQEFPDGIPEEFGAPWIGTHPEAGAAGATGLPPEVEERVARVVATQKSRKGRPVEYEHSHYEAVADVYLNAAKNPTRTVAEAWRKNGVDLPYTTAARWVRRCRDLGLLTDTTQGKRKGN